jgi:hypothetical protein
VAFSFQKYLYFINLHQMEDADLEFGTRENPIELDAGTEENPIAIDD